MACRCRECLCAGVVRLQLEDAREFENSFFDEEV